MTYQVTFTESNNPAKQPLTVQDQSLNNQTSLTFVGRNYAGYGSIIANDFLHLLENFANSTAPNNPVQGQLWYDTSVSTLKVYDGTIWNNSGSLKKASSAPAVANSLQGDLWVDTANSQLYLFSGSNWLLVGPQFAQGSLTGPVVESIIDTNNITHSVISLYASAAISGTSYPISIISKDTFTPKLSIQGFTTINQGVNLSQIDNATAGNLSRFHGTATSSDGLLIGTNVISSANFLRSDASSVTNFPLSVRSNGGISVGSDLSFNIGTSGNSTVFYSKNSGNSINFSLNNSGVTQSVIYLDATGKVGIGPNNTSPVSTLDVSGLITVSTGLDVTGTTNSVYTPSTAYSSVTGSIKTRGGLTVSLNSNFGGTVSAYGNILVNNLISGNPSAGAVMLPGTDSADGLYDIGSATRKFRNIYAQNFVGTFNGSFTGSLAGSVNGAAAKLSSPTAFSMIGDVLSNIVSFDGQSANGTAIFSTTISSNLITNKPSATDSNLTDELLVFRPGTGLLNMTKQTLLNHVATVPPGVIMPFAGTIVPTGYLLCDGSEVRISVYPTLFAIIGYTYKAASLLNGQSSFALPDLRGRFPLGRDNMDNNLTVPYKDGSGTLVDAGGGPADRVTDVTADLVGSGTGVQQVTLAISNIPDHKHNLSSASAQYYAAGIPNAGSDPNAIAGLGLPASSTGSGLPNSGSVISSTTGQPVGIMNPYQTINYIIFTGVI